MKFFTSSNDLKNWVLGNESYEFASNNITEVIGTEDELSIKQACQTIFDLNSKIKKEEKDVKFDKDIEETTEILFAILSKYNLTEIKKEGFMNKKTSQINDFSIREAQVTRPPSSPYTGREDDNKYVGTPWRRDRDAIYDFTHRNPDMLSFDDNPNHVYSGEALWRRYVMDKFYRDYKDDKGRVVGGYINDRFKVYHDLGGNQLELANGERTRKPRPHQYSVERRLQEARDEKPTDILPLRASASSVRVIITGSDDSPAKDTDIRYVSNSEDDYVDVQSRDIKEDNDVVTQAFADILDMRTAGISDKDIILKVSEHYKMPISKVANIKNFAIQVKANHEGIMYSCASSAKKEVIKKEAQNQEGIVIQNDEPAIVVNLLGSKIGEKMIPARTVLAEQDPINGNPTFIVKDLSQGINQAERIMFPNGLPDNYDNGIDEDMAMAEGEDPYAESTNQTVSASSDFTIKEV